MVLPRALLWALLVASAASASQPPSELQNLRQSAYQLVQDKNYSEAFQKYRELRSLALTLKDRKVALQALNGIGAAYFGLYQYRQAIEVFEGALAEATAMGSKEVESMIAGNVVSLYSSLGDTAQAMRILQRYPLNGSSIADESRLEWYTVLLQVYSRARDAKRFAEVLPWAEAEAIRPLPANLREANSKRFPKWTEAYGELRRASLFDVLSDAYVEFNDLPSSLQYAREAYRIRAVFQDPLRLRALTQQCMLERKLGHFDEAWRISEVAVQRKDLNPTPMQLFRIHRERALILIAKGNTAAALTEFRRAMAYPRAWRSEILPADSTILSFENFMNGQIHQEFLSAIASLPETAFTRELAEESFWVAEEARFASLRAAFLPRDAIAKRLESDYWPLLRKFQDLQTKILAGDAGSIRERDRIESELHRKELRAGLSVPHLGGHKAHERTQFAAWQRGIPSDESVFAFHISETTSLAWAISTKGIEMKKLAGRRQLAEQANAFLVALEDTPKAKGRGTSSSLTKNLFGEFSYPYRTKPFWTVVVDDTLARIPMSALPLVDDPNRYLVEAHTIRLLPSATMLQSSASGTWGGKAVAFADPVYNSADERVSSVSPTTGTWELNRLPATLREAKLSFAPLAESKWTTAITTGLEANAPKLRGETLASPDILHIATHFSPDPERPDLLSIALSTPSAAQPTLFSAKDLTALRTGTKLVVLDGCASATGTAYSGLGIVGLSRAWLISGASNVVGTLWPIPDEAGPFFSNFYRRISGLPYSSRSISTSLRETQLDLLRRKDRYAAPRYWAAYVLLQRS